MRQEALLLLQNALEGSGGSAAASAYSEAFRLIMRFAIVDKSFVVRIAGARCLKAFAHIGGPCLGVGELDNSATHCVKVIVLRLFQIFLFNFLEADNSTSLRPLKIL